MRNAFRLKASSSAQLLAAAAAAAETATEPGGNNATTCPITEQASSLRTAQGHLPGIRMWFEQGKEADARAAGGEGRVGAGDSGGGGGGASSSTIKAVYSEAWGEDDGQFNALAFLFTLCAVPRDKQSTSDVEEGEDDDGERYTIVSGGVEFILSILFYKLLFLAATYHSIDHRSSTPSQQSSARTCCIFSVHHYSSVSTLKWYWALLLQTFVPACGESGDACASEIFLAIPR